MKFIKIVLILLLYNQLAQGQKSLQLIIKDENSRPLVNTTIKLSWKNASQMQISDLNGIAIFQSIPDSTVKVDISQIGYQAFQQVVPLTKSINQLEISLNPSQEELEEVVVSSTRSSRTIHDIPTRIEFIGGEEISEKSNMKSGDIRMLLSESTGIQVQQTSATSANASIRIQGLDGRYTQLLKDGFPLYSGAASGLGLLQIPPLDLKQVEIIKGSASTLYGGGAIAGLVNLISKNPTEERDFKIHINTTSAKGFDFNTYYAKRNQKIGTTIFASFNRNSPYDPGNIDLSAIPEFQRFTLNPKIYLYPSDNNKLILGLNMSYENRLGGDIHYINGLIETGHLYFESNKTKRISSQFTWEHKFSPNKLLTFKNSISYFNRKISVPDYRYDGTQYSTFSELSFAHYQDKSEWVLGANAWTDVFDEIRFSSFPLRNYTQGTVGLFAQNSTKIWPWLHIETGLRGDYVYDYGWQFLPRASALINFSEKFSSRIGGGFGYKTPTIFTEESERIQYQNVLPINKKMNVVENSKGINLDFNYKTSIGEDIQISANHLFFYTLLENPLLMESRENGQKEFLVNSKGHIDSKGTETNVKVNYQDFHLFLGYTYTNTQLHLRNIFEEKPLTPRHKFNSVLMYELEKKWKIGLEAYYFSPQILSDGATGKDYWLTGFMVEKFWHKLSIYINFENFLDVRQTKFDTIYTGSKSNPTFRDIYAPLDGFMINGGIKLKL